MLKEQKKKPFYHIENSCKNTQLVGKGRFHGNTAAEIGATDPSHMHVCRAGNSVLRPLPPYLDPRLLM